MPKGGFNNAANRTSNSLISLKRQIFRTVAKEKKPCLKMVKYTVWNDCWLKCENTKFTRELNTYGYDENGIGEELLFPIRLNEPSGGNKETSLATYLVKFKEFEKTFVKIKNDAGKERFSIFV